jgi:hypothetical protein
LIDSPSIEGILNVCFLEKIKRGLEKAYVYKQDFQACSMVVNALKGILDG